MVTEAEHRALSSVGVPEPVKKLSWPSIGTILRYGSAYTVCAAFTAFVAIVLGGTIDPQQDHFHAWMIGMVILCATGVALAAIAGTAAAVSNYCYQKTTATLHKPPTV